MNTQNNVIEFPRADATRQSRGAFVKRLMDNDGRSVRYVSMRIGISHTALGDRVKGRTPFLADELESIASVLKLDPIEFYRDYISVTADSPEPTNRRTLVP